MADLKFYFSDNSNSDISPTDDATWDGTNGKFWVAPSEKANTSQYNRVCGDNRSGTHYNLIASSITASIATGRNWTTADTIKMVFEGKLHHDLTSGGFYVVIKIVSSDGLTERGILYEGEFPTALTADDVVLRRTIGGGTDAVNVQNAVTAQNNDRIVIELGGKVVNPGGTGYIGVTAYYGDENAKSDLAYTEGSASYGNPWIEFTYGAASTSVTPEAALISGTGDQPAPEVMGDANLAPNALDQETELLDPDIDTTRNLGVGNYRSTKVTMNW